MPKPHIEVLMDKISDFCRKWRVGELSLFGNPVYRSYVYDSANLSQVRQFALTDSVEVMVMTLDSFNKASNVIRQSTDRL